MSITQPVCHRKSSRSHPIPTTTKKRKKGPPPFAHSGVRGSPFLLPVHTNYTLFSFISQWHPRRKGGSVSNKTSLFRVPFPKGRERESQRENMSDGGSGDSGFGVPSQFVLGCQATFRSPPVLMALTNASIVPRYYLGSWMR